jgi:hypothetical protein
LSSNYGNNKKLWVAGFGNTKSDANGYYADTLEHVEISYVKPNKCKNAYGASVITKNMLCAADENVDSCKVIATFCELIQQSSHHNIVSPVKDYFVHYRVIQVDHCSIPVIK